MRLLLTNRSLGSYDGSVTWLVAMFVELTVARGFDVDVLVPAKTHNLYRHLPVYDPWKHYDLALVNHRDSLPGGVLPGNVDRSVFTSHGVLSWSDRPPGWADHVVSVSEETRDFNRQFGWESAVIRQPVDLVEFRPVRKPNSTVKNVLWLSNRQSGHHAQVIHDACKGWGLRVVGGRHQRGDVAEHINDADVVITIGRGAVESMACGRNVVVYGPHGGDGFVTPELALDFRYSNYSGRFHRHQFTADQLRNAIAGRYDPSLGGQLRDYVRRHHDVSDIVDQYLAVAGIS